ncbi:hypothetical protein Pfo_021335 [Paulownia fortunei]|nr:hypothetical protein Pfo_021335 [Paulownia fortunei]
MEIYGEDKERQPPLLLISHGASHEKQSFYSVLENRFHTTCIPILCSKDVFASTYGWLVLVDIFLDECCLWNPSLYNRCILSKLPTDPDCHILFNSSSTLEQSFCQIGDDEFVTQSFQEEDTDVRSLLAIGSFQGKIYGFTNPGYRFVTVHFVGKTLELRPILKEDGEGGGQPWHIPRLSRPWATWNQNYLIESPCGDELLLVHKMSSCNYLKDRSCFRVFRVDTNRMECMELYNIGKRAIFLSHWNGGFCSSSLGIKTNSIYYTDKAGSNVYMYDLDDRSTTLMLPPCPAAARYQSATYWVEHAFQNLILF